MVAGGAVPYTYTFTNAYWYLPVMMLLANNCISCGDRPFQAREIWPAEIPDQAIYLTGMGETGFRLDEFETAAGAENVLRTTSRWRTVTDSYGVVLIVVILRNNGNTTDPNQWMPIDKVNRGRSYLFRNIRPGYHPETANETGGKITQDITEQVRRYNAVIPLGVHDELHAHIVDNPVLKFDVGIFRRNLLTDSQEHPGRNLENIGLVHERDLMPSVFLSVVKTKPDDPLRPGLCHPCRRIGDLETLVERLDSRVESLRVLPEQGEVNMVEGRLDSR